MGNLYKWHPLSPADDRLLSFSDLLKQVPTFLTLQLVNRYEVLV
jgi:hypothetical protein